jgi:hypothetical protein
MDPESFGGNLPRIIADYLRGLDDIAEDDIAAWRAELRRPRCARRVLLRLDAVLLQRDAAGPAWR